LKDMTCREVIYMLPLLVMVFWIGLYPNFFLNKMHVSVDKFIAQTKVERHKGPHCPVQHASLEMSQAAHGQVAGQ